MIVYLEMDIGEFGEFTVTQNCGDLNKKSMAGYVNAIDND